MAAVHRGPRRSSFLTTLYDACVAFQAASADLVIFSPLAGEFVIVAWYVSNMWLLSVI